MTTARKSRKPTVKLIGEDGNAFAIMGRCRRAAISAGWTKDQITKVLNEMMSSDYNNLLQVAAKYFKVY